MNDESLKIDMDEFTNFMEMNKNGIVNFEMMMAM